MFFEQQNIPFDCIILTEIHQINNSLNEFNILEYNLEYNDGGINQFDATVIYLRSSLSYKKS